MKTVLKFIDKMYKEKTAACCAAVAVIVLLTDYITGKNIQFPVLYILPAGMAAWRNKKNFAYALAVILPAARICFHFPWGQTETLYFAVINGMIRMSVLSFYVYLIDITASQTRKLEKRVKVLEGIVPICASCKKIRNPEGKYEQMEKYITEHSEAVFSHGICDECARKLYPDFYPKPNMKSEK